MQYNFIWSSTEGTNITPSSNITRTTVLITEPDSLHTAAVTSKGRDLLLRGHVPQNDALVATGSQQMVFSRHPIQVKHSIGVRQPI